MKAGRSTMLSVRRITPDSLSLLTPMAEEVLVGEDALIRVTRTGFALSYALDTAPLAKLCRLVRERVQKERKRRKLIAERQACKLVVPLSEFKAKTAVVGTVGVVIFNFEFVFKNLYISEQFQTPFKLLISVILIHFSHLCKEKRNLLTKS